MDRDDSRGWTLIAPIDGIVSRVGNLYGNINYNEKEKMGYYPFIVLKTREKTLLSPISLYRPYFEFLRENKDWIETALRRANYHTYKGNWYEMAVEQEKILENMVCPCTANTD